MLKEKKYIIIEGLIGSGKTSLCKKLKERTDIFGDIKVHLEPAENTNPYLDKYYKEPEKYSFNMQIFLLGKRFRAHTAAQAGVLNGDYTVISDRSYWGDRCFAEIQKKLGYFSEDDYNTYMSLHKDMQRFLLYPSACIFLDTGVDLAMKRIARRQSEIEGRECECAITKDYMTMLNDEIVRMIDSFSNYCPVLKIKPLKEDGSEKTLEELSKEVIDYVTNLNHNVYDAWQGVL